MGGILVGPCVKSYKKAPGFEQGLWNEQVENPKDREIGLENIAIEPNHLRANNSSANSPWETFGIITRCPVIDGICNGEDFDSRHSTAGTSLATGFLSSVRIISLPA